jgi:glycosyltransferase involved in cell wall biosynthesis
MITHKPEMSNDPACHGAPLVSVVTPCYNAASFIVEMIASVAAQSWPAVEHIVVDDGSTDGSWAIINGAVGQITPVRLEQNRGGSHARNVGAALARGSFLMFLDADDLIASDSLAALVTAARERPGSIAICKWRRLSRIGNEWRATPAEVPLPTPSTDYFRGWLERSWGVPPCAVLWPRDVYQSTGGWDEQLRVDQDTDLLLRALASGVSLVRAIGGTGYYRMHGESRLSVCNDLFSEERIRSQRRVLEKALAGFASHGGVPKKYAEPIGRYYQRLAALAFQQGTFGLGRECLRAAEGYGVRSPTAATPGGRLLSRMLGLEAKERIAQALAGWGIMTMRRRRFLQRQEEYLRRQKGSA